MQFVCSNTGDVTFSVYDVVAVDQNGSALAMNPLNLTVRESMPSTTAGVNGKTAPSVFALHQNFPTPFNPSTNVSFSLPSQMFVSLKIFDVMGREVTTLASEELNAGTHKLQWDASGMPSGVYFYCLQAGSYTMTKRLVLLR